MGRGCLQGEHILRFEVETYGCSTSTTTSMSCDVPINLLTLVPVSVHLSDPLSESKSPLLVTDTQLASSFNSIVSMKLMESNGIASSSNASSSDSSNVIIISYHITLYSIISYSIISYHIKPHNIISYHIRPHNIISYHIRPHNIISYHIISYYIISYHTMSH